MPTRFSRVPPKFVIRILLLFGSHVATFGTTAGAQSTLQNTPNIATGWVAPRHELLFDLVHRFSIGPAPTRKVLNASTLGLYGGVTSQLQVGLTYASASEFIPTSPNEFEFSSRVRIARQHFGSPVDVFTQVAYNQTLRSWDAQANIGRQAGDARVVLTATWLSDAFKSGKGRGAIGGGIILPLMKQMALAGDVTTLLNRERGEKVTWSVGLQMAIAETPHTLSVHMSNVAGRTLQGSLAASASRRVGFEYTIPITFGARKIAIGPQ